MDDREIAKIMRKRNLAYVKHLEQTQPHSEKHDTLEGGFLSALATAARIAARAAAKAAATAAKAGAKAAAKAGKAAAKAAKAAARAAKTGAKSLTKGSRLEKLDNAMTAADLAQTAYAVAQIAMEKTRKGETLSEEDWNELDNTQKVMIDFQRWARGLDAATYNLFKERGGDKPAAMQTVRLMDAGLNPDDWVSNEVEAKYESITDGIEELDDINPADDDECQAKLEEDDRSQEERIGLEVLALVDFGIGQAISERKLEERQRQRYNQCVEQKTRQIKNDRDGLMAQLGLGPDDEFDIENQASAQFVADQLAATNPIMKLAIELDGFRAMNGLPPIDRLGNALKDPLTIANNNCERIAIWFINNKTIDYSNQQWIKDLLNGDPTIVNRAIARMPYYEYFAADIPEVNQFRTSVTLSDSKEAGKKVQTLEEWLDDPDIQASIKQSTEETRLYDEKEEAQAVKNVFDPTRSYNIGEKVLYNAKVYKCTQTTPVGTLPTNEAYWDELSLYNQDDYDALKNIGSATEWVAYKQYPVDSFVTYAPKPDTLWVKIKDTPAGINPEDATAWEQVLLKNADLLDLTTNPGRKWDATKNYKVGDLVYWATGDLQSYKAILDSTNVRPDTKPYWRQIKTFNLDDELVKRIKIEQRAAIFASAVGVAEDFDPDVMYELNDIVCGFDGNYYQLIKEKKDRDGDVVAPPLPPNKTYWKLISDGVTVFDPSKQYNVNDFTLYDKVYYICIKANTPVGTLPTDKNYWEELDPIFENLDPEIVQQNTERFYDAIMNRSEEYMDDVTQAYQIGDIAKVFDNDGYPQFYECIKDIPFAYKAKDEDIRKAEPYNNGKIYLNGNIISFEGIIYKMKAQNLGQGYNPLSYPSMWEPLGYEKDPAPPNPEFWTDYSEADVEDEKYEKMRDSAINGTKDATEIYVGSSIVKDPETGFYYKLAVRPKVDIYKYPFYGNKDFGTEDYYSKMIHWVQGKTFKERKEKYQKDNPGSSFIFGLDMNYLPDFNNQKRTNYRQNNTSSDLSEYFMWVPQDDIPTELEARIKTIESSSKWKNNKLYKRDDLVVDKYGLKYLCLKDTPYAPMEPFYNPDYFVQLDEREWDDAMQTARYNLEDKDEASHQYDDILFTKADSKKPRKWGEVVYYNNKFYKFLAAGEDFEAPKDKTFIPRQEEPGKLRYDGEWFEWNECENEDGKLKIQLDTDYPNVKLENIIFYMYTRGGPIVKIGDKYFVANMGYKEIFGQTGADNWRGGEWDGFWGPLHEYARQKYRPDIMATEVFADGKPKFKHDANGDIIGENIDVSSLPKVQAAAVTETVDKTKDKITCPTAEDDGDDDEEDTHHEETTAERELEKAMIEWVAKGSDPATDPRLVYNTPPPPPPTTGKGAGYNIEELDGSQYHQKKKRVYKRKNKSKM